MTTRRRHRSLSNCIAAAVAVAGMSGAAWAVDPLFMLDLRVHGTGGKEAVVSAPGDSVVLDLYIRANGQDANPNNDDVHNLFSNFRTSAGGLGGDLIGLPPPAPFNLLTSQPGRQNDLDGDGDLDIGSFNHINSLDYYFSRGGPISHIQPAGGFLVASVRFTASVLNAETTEVSWFPRDNPGLSLLGTVDGVAWNGSATAPSISLGAPVTIRAESVNGGGTTEFLSGTVNTHLVVDHTIRQGTGSPLILNNGVTAIAGGLFDMRNAQGSYAGQEVRVSDVTSKNDGGAIFVDRLQVGVQAPGQFSQTRGLTQIGSSLVLGATTGNDGTLLVSGGTMRARDLAIGNAANGHVEQTGGFLTVDNLGMSGATGTTSTAKITGGVFTVSNFGTLGGGGGVSLLEIDGGAINFNRELYVFRTAGDVPALKITSGTANLQDTFIAGGASVQQTGGDVAASAVGIGMRNGAGLSIPSVYSLSGGTLRSGGVQVGDQNTPALLEQTGGTLISGGIVGVLQTYNLSAGDANLWGTYIYRRDDGPGLIDQSGGSLVTDYLVVQGIYRISGGTFQVNKELRVENGGTIDFVTPGGLLAVGNNSLIEIPAQGLTNTANATLVGKPGSLINYQPGQDPRDRFGAVEISGLLHEQGTPLHIPAGKSVTGAGLILGNTTNDGELHPGYVGGRLDITGSYAQSTDAKLVMELAGGDFGSRDYFAVSGAANLQGVLDIDLVGGYLPDAGDVFAIVSASSITGRFSNADSQVFFDGGRFDISYTSTNVILRNFAAVPEPTCIGMLLGGGMLVRSRSRRTGAIRLGLGSAAN